MKKILGSLLIVSVSLNAYLVYDMYKNYSLPKQVEATKQISEEVIEEVVEVVPKAIVPTPANYTYQLKDSRTGQVIQQYDPINFNDEKVYKQDITKLAKQLATQYDQSMQNVRLDASGQLTGGQKRVVLKEKELMENLQHLTLERFDVNVPIYETTPNVTAEAVQGVNEVVVGTYTTKFNGSDTGRTRNIELSAQAIQNVVLGPGDSFSYNDIVGERTPERGYQPAPEIVEKELVMGIGGGICQTSSTLFNAVDAAGLKTVTRTHHSKEVGYVPAGRDATVSWGGPDYKFMNPQDYPVIIKTVMNKAQGTLTIEVRTAQRYL
ncbi:VanW family protein [Metabacillus iocasae]|uniref:Vancomycin resistance protein YoaR n=1 Tax=Priestia iocasae TaxID=2291674 RepID=A0ABS2QW61_9BACI|nr:VanW family protein [Metabacillus iocasae]MBM7703720.1 vancomycin resistance protein YoaR [Metabacillus iocasae]